MASRLIHLAIAEKLLKSFSVSDKNRFLLGSILPDARLDSALRAAPHYQIILPSGLVTYDLSSFRKEFGDRLMRDELYLGYYLHLIQDMVYRRYMYALPHWDARIPGNVAKLHGDYRRINRYIIESRSIKNEVCLPENFSSEDINLRFCFESERFMEELKQDFIKTADGEFFVFTPSMADEFIQLAAEASLRELDALQKGLPLCNEIEMAWGKE